MNKIPIVESYWVEEKLFLAGEYPSGYAVEDARRRLDSFLEAGIRTFIDLTQPNELPSYEPLLAEQARIRGCMAVHHRIPIRDHSVPSIPVMRLILDTIDSSIESGEPVYVHCWGGVGRTGTVVGCYLVRRGLSARQALERVDALYKTRPQDFLLHSSPETQEQINFVRNWREDPAARRMKRRYCEG